MEQLFGSLSTEVIFGAKAMVLMIVEVAIIVALVRFGEHVADRMKEGANESV